MSEEIKAVAEPATVEDIPAVELAPVATVAPVVEVEEMVAGPAVKVPAAPVVNPPGFVEWLAANHLVDLADWRRLAVAELFEARHELACVRKDAADAMARGQKMRRQAG